MFLQLPFFMHFFKINIIVFDFCINYVLNIDMTNVFQTLKLIKNEKINFSDYCICTSLPINCHS